MVLLAVISCLFLASCSAAPVNQKNGLVVTENFFSESQSFVMYTGQHDIVKIFVPFNQFNFDDDSRESSSSKEMEHRFTVFFVEADVENGKTTEQGLYIFKNGKASKLLHNGKDATATNENVIYFGASDGIYKYNEAANKAEKYGTVTDNIIQLAHSNKTNAVYYLTDKHELYKLSDDATTSVKLPLVDAQTIAFDFFDNMYYYDSNKNVYVVESGAGNVPKKIEGLPSEMHKISLVSAMYGAEDQTLFLVDDRIYFLGSNGKATKSLLRVEVQVTAAAPQPALIQFYAKDKKIYEFNILALFFNKLVEELRKFLEDNKKTINSIKKGSFACD